MKSEQISIRTDAAFKKKAIKQAKKKGFAGLTAYITHLIIKDEK